MRTTVSAGCKLLAAALLASCAAVAPSSVQVEHAYVLYTGDGMAARALVRGAACPAIVIDGAARAMSVRAPAAEIATRTVAQGLSKPARFDLTVCEAPLPAGVRHAQVGGIDLSLPAGKGPRRIVVIGDTGCRMKQSENAFQSCTDSAAWPFARVASAAARLKPDMVIHVGDYHYRESPCPAGEAACAGSPWGFGQDVWTADFFAPAQPLLMAAPWVFVRGNHETCSRAGQGWFRMLDAAPFTPSRSCDLAANDAAAAHTAPFTVRLGDAHQLIVFDSSEQADAKAAFAAEFAEVERLAALAPHSIFLSHHPVLGLGLPAKGKDVKPAAKGMLASLQAAHPGRLFPDSVELALHGHVHLFEALGFASGGTPTFVLGNSGSLGEGSLLAKLPLTGTQLGPATIDSFHTRGGYGFALLERSGAQWQLTEYDLDGVARMRCAVASPTLRCTGAGGR